MVHHQVVVTTMDCVADMPWYVTLRQYVAHGFLKKKCNPKPNT